MSISLDIIAVKRIRVLFIARNRDESMHRKLVYLFRQGDLDIRYVFPLAYHNELVEYRDIPTDVEGVKCAPVYLMGPQSDPHRVMYRSLGFGMRAFQPHIVHVEEEPDSLAALQVALARRVSAPRSRLILNTWQNIDRPKNPMVKAVIRFCLAESSAVMCANSEAVQLLRHWGYSRPTPLIPPIGVDTQLFHPAHKCGLTGDPVRVIYLGRLVPEKGLDVLISAFTTLLRASDDVRLTRNVQLKLIGNGPDLNRLKLQVDAAGIASHVEFHPAVPSNEVAGLLQQSDILVLPSRTMRTWKEQFGHVLIEAMACKVAIIGSNSGAIPEVIGDAGLTFREGDANDLATKLAYLIQAPDEMNMLVERGYTRVNLYYTQECIATQTAAVYRHLS